jgi:hypothetical protein
VTTRSNSPGFALFCGCNTLLVHCFFLGWIFGWKIVRSDSQQYILVALKENDTNFAVVDGEGTVRQTHFAFVGKIFWPTSGFCIFPTQEFLAKRTMWDSVLVIWPFVTFHVMKLNMSKEFNCVFLQDIDRCDGRP